VRRNGELVSIIAMSGRRLQRETKISQWRRREVDSKLPQRGRRPYRLFKAPDKALGGFVSVGAIEVGGAQVMPFGAVAQHAPSGSEHRGSHAENGLLGAAARNSARLALTRVVMRESATHRHLSIFGCPHMNSPAGDAAS
jgi:hypothetical protein